MEIESTWSRQESQWHQIKRISSKFLDGSITRKDHSALIEHFHKISHWFRLWIILFSWFLNRLGNYGLIHGYLRRRRRLLDRRLRRKLNLWWWSRKRFWRLFHCLWSWWWWWRRKRRWRRNECRFRYERMNFRRSKGLIIKIGIDLFLWCGLSVRWIDTRVDRCLFLCRYVVGRQILLSDWLLDEMDGDRTCIGRREITSWR